MMAIRKASEVVGAVRDADRMRYDRDRNEYAGRAVTADRLSIVKRLRKLAPAGLATFEPFEHICSQLEAELHAASIEPEPTPLGCDGGSDWESDPRARKPAQVERKCKGCGRPLLPENTWMTDGCPCNSPRGCNDDNSAERDAAIRQAAIRECAALYEHDEQPETFRDRIFALLEKGR